MTPQLEIPTPHHPFERRGTHVEPPSVYIESRWEYREVTRDLAAASPLPTETELNTLGAEGWELAGVVTQGQQVHFYFKRERTR